MSHADIESILTLMDPACGGSDDEIEVHRHLLATTSCEKCGTAAYDAIRLSLAFPGNLLDAWDLYKEVAPRIEDGVLEIDIDPGDFARIALLACPRILERQPTLVAQVARAAQQAIQRANVTRWTRLDITGLAQAWLARSLRYSGDYQRAFSISRRTSSQLKGCSSLTKAEVLSVYASCLHDLGKPHRAFLSCKKARESFREAGLSRESAQQLLIQASVCWEFWRDGERAEAAVLQCLQELPSWDQLWRNIALVNLMQFQAEQGKLQSLPAVSRFENPNWEFRRIWNYAKAYRALGRFDLAHQAYGNAKAMLDENDFQWIEVELDYCGLLVQEGRISEVCRIAGQAVRRVESSEYRDYFSTPVSLLRKAVARRLLSEDVFRYIQRRTTLLGLTRSA